ncbi:Fis family transcriptional regulator [Mucilaginibacter hurinus]|uniref:Fis family transcriptional regulator n=1 Tax=Mucilaginibacter hurinus TaxID=2201324 RepID=A0A367GS28_9SPHI|nr:phosphoenolpyruvate hydrolase family protein [Mucilaginibacter hurinus]RCH56060.1 Fis family transcriptional regulator [Mucilaginibacter hurinus]
MSLLKNVIKNADRLASPFISVATGSGHTAKSAVESGADMIIALNAGFYRNIGYGTLAAFMPYGNANNQTEEMLKYHILPHVSSTPIVAGVFATDPELPVKKRLERLKALGVEGITNWPAIGFIDGAFRDHLEAEGLGIEAEVAMLQQAGEMGFVTFGFALSAEDACTFAKSNVDALILNVGLTFEMDDAIEKRNQLQLSITKAKEMLTMVHDTGHKPFSLLYGGYVTKPEDFDEFLKQIPLHGYAGGSVFERFPVEQAINAQVKSFKNIPFPNTNANTLPRFGNLVGSSAPMKNLFTLIQKIAPYNVNVCIDGESGTGKELVANQIHLLSPRKSHPFITVNCGAIPDTLVESEFFGYEKGAFTGAAMRRQGKFELANKGTLFLDEIADLSPHAQAALLRVIQQGEIVTLGGQKPTPVDVRILCASNQNLEKLVEEGKFRVDLYFRLSTIIIKIPPLRERSGDVPLLVSNILAKLSIKFDKKLIGVTNSFMDRLKNNHWTGNVRELEQVITRHALIEDAPILEGKAFKHADKPAITQSYNENNHERAVRAMREAGGNKSKAANLLGISRKTLYVWIKEGDEQL